MQQRNAAVPIPIPLNKPKTSCTWTAGGFFTTKRCSQQANVIKLREHPVKFRGKSSDFPLNIYPYDFTPLRYVRRCYLKSKRLLRRRHWHSIVWIFWKSFKIRKNNWKNSPSQSKGLNCRKLLIEIINGMKKECIKSFPFRAEIFLLRFYEKYILVFLN